MTGAELLDWLWFRVWWAYPANAPTWHDRIYSGFNVVEGVIWLALAAYVLLRYARRGRSRIELAYALAFATFGVSDFVEAHALSSGLILTKGVNLVVLFALRRAVVARCHPGSAL